MKLVRFSEIQHSFSPTTEDRHIGIEFECVSTSRSFEVAQALAGKGGRDWGKWLSYLPSPGGIGDIPYEHASIEFRVLSRVTVLASRLAVMKDIFKVIDAKVTRGCGLHVHLDMRHADYSLAGKRLFACQEALYRLCERYRRESNWCLPNIGWEGNSKSSGINAGSSYRQRQTIEIRMKEGTLNVDEVELWAKLLAHIAYHKDDFSEQRFTTPQDLIAMGLPKVLEKYVKTHQKW